MSFIITLLGHISGPFVVAFVETAYTVDESMPALNVCVNLTQPLTDILSMFMLSMTLILFTSHLMLHWQVRYP